MTVDTVLGAFGIDAIVARSSFIESQRWRGNNKARTNYRLRFTSDVTKIGTRINMSADYYPSEGFYSLEQTAIINDDTRNIISLNDNAFLNYRLSLSVSQSLGSTWGSLYATGIHRKYARKYQDYSIGYSNRWGLLSYSIAAQFHENSTNNSKWEKDWLFSVSMPLGRKRHSPFLIAHGLIIMV